MVNRDLMDEYCSLELSELCLGCHLVYVGQEFIVDDPTVAPEGFCAWAWGDLQKDVNTILFGGNYPHIKQPGIAIVSCSDGLMPVIFKIERLDS
jgi:uncharacterized repeat protein (TIGR04076 family)